MFYCHEGLYKIYKVSCIIDSVNVLPVEAHAHLTLMIMIEHFNRKNAGSLCFPRLMGKYDGTQLYNKYKETLSVML